QVRFDPFAMLPFMGYNVGDYINHWLEIGDKAPDASRLPQMFWVNWFRKNDEGKFIWPGFGENSRVLKWVLERVAGEGEATETAIGLVPTAGALEVDGLGLSEADMSELLSVDNESWRGEIPLIEEHYDFIGERLPPAMRDELRELEKRLSE
ncbi:MAG: phosphoenolpyruvate carboxykinase (GTP), partial [Actinomycetia bacterium]|nr:phosphoenolpyruvate carboxykinase (GTP) [Actinomycetes bacterium]